MKHHFFQFPIFLLFFYMSCQSISDSNTYQKVESFKVKGKIYSLNLKTSSFDLLKETAIDPTNHEGRSRYPVDWTDSTTFTKITIQNNFKGIEGKRWAYFHKLDQGRLNADNAKAAKSGKSFIALHVIILEKNEDPTSYKETDNSVIGLFSANPQSKNHREGSIEIHGINTPVRLRGPKAEVKINQSIEVHEIGSSGWECEVLASEKKGHWTAETVDVFPTSDPRDSDDPKLPRVLVIGDSISMNYHEAAKKALKGVANYYRNDGNAGPSDRGTLCIDLWLGDYQTPGLHWDLIQFNFGLHDLKQMYDEQTQRYGQHQLPLEQYKNNLESVIQQLKKTGAKLVWCTTTPVPQSSTGKWGDKVMGRRKNEDLVFNTAAKDVLANHPDIHINDTNTFIRESKDFSTWFQQKDVHFWGRDLQELVGQAVAKQLKEILNNPPANP